MKSRFLLALFGAAVGLILAELLLSARGTEKTPLAPYGVSFQTDEDKPVWGKPAPFRLILSPFTLYKSRPNQQGKVFRINSAGFRGKETALVSPFSFRVIVMGRSTAFGHGAGSDEETIQAFLERDLPDSEVINAGVIGFQSSQELVYLVTELADYSPQWVVSLSGWNDCYPSIREFPGVPSIGTNGMFFALEDILADHYQMGRGLRGVFKHLSAVLLGRSELYREIRPRWSSLPRNTSEVFARRWPADPRTDPAFKRAVRSYSTNMRKMRDFCRSQETGFLVLLQPGRPLPSYEIFLAEVKKCLLRERVPFIDVHQDQQFAQARDSLLVGDMHLNAKGNARVAAILSDYLSQAAGRKSS